MAKRITPHRNIQFVWLKPSYWRRPFKYLRRGRKDERICWRYTVLRRYIARFGYLQAVPDLIALLIERTLDYIFIAQHKRYLPTRTNEKSHPTRWPFFCPVASSYMSGSSSCSGACILATAAISPCSRCLNLITASTSPIPPVFSSSSSGSSGGSWLIAVRLNTFSL